MTEKWTLTRRTASSVVTLTGDQYSAQTRGHHNKPAALIGSVEVVWRWSVGSVLDKPYNVIMLTVSPRDGRPNGGRLYLSDLLDVPDWLDSIITRSRNAAGADE